MPFSGLVWCLCWEVLRNEVFSQIFLDCEVLMNFSFGSIAIREASSKWFPHVTQLPPDKRTSQRKKKKVLRIEGNKMRRLPDRRQTEGRTETIFSYTKLTAGLWQEVCLPHPWRRQDRASYKSSCDILTFTLYNTVFEYHF